MMARTIDFNIGESGPMIALRDIHLAFGQQKVLEGVSLSVNRNEIVAIVGPSGSGKSTLIKIVAGLIEPDSGDVVLASDRVGLAFQYGALFTSLTVEDNIALALERTTKLDKNTIDERVDEALTMVELEGVRDKFPSELSGGMQKRVGIARALAIHPDIMLYDEPSAGLDPILADKLESDLRTINQQLRIATIVVTHEIPTIENLANRVVLLFEGHFVYEGRKDDFFSTRDPLVLQFRRRTQAGPVQPG
jgi:phospholipid/cholesterol/gamma-HCH transport system ATP-binding protein